MRAISFHIRLAFSKIIDYLLLLAFFIVIASFLLLSFSSIQILTITCLLPLLFMPLEIISLKLFQRTLGQFLVGIRLKEKKPLSSLLKLSFSSMLKALTLFLPFFNIVFAFYWLKKEANPSYMIQKGSFFSRTIFACIYLSFCLYSYTHFALEITHSPQASYVTSHGKKNLNWMTFKHPNLEWVAKFPKTPEKREVILKLPDDQVSQVQIEEHFLTDNNAIEYTISSIEIPQRLLSWGYKLILNGSVKIVTDNLPKAKLLSKKITQFKEIPSLVYTLEENSFERLGRLVLIGNTLYKVEVSYPKEKREELQDELNHFIDSIEFAQA